MPDKYGVQSWEQMVMQIVVHGRPNDIRAAAAGWDLVLRNLNSVRTSLDQNVADLGTTWNGEAYESFKEHIAAISENIQAVSDEANRMNTVTGTLTESAARLEAAQNEIPIPAGLEDEVAAARNEGGGIPDGFFEAAGVGLLGLPFGPIGVASATGLGALLSATGAFDALSDWLNDRTDEARVIWNRVNFEIEGEAGLTPTGIAVAAPGLTPMTAVPLGTGGPGGDLGALTGGGGTAGATPALSTGPSAVGSTAPPGTGAFDPAAAGAPQLGTAAPATGGTPAVGSDTAGFDPDAVTPGTGAFDPGAVTPGTGAFDPGAATPGTGAFDPGALGTSPAGAVPPGGTGLAGAGLGTGGLGGLGAGGVSAPGTPGIGTGALSTGALGAPGGAGASGGGLGAGGLGAGGLVGGGALGKPVSPGQAGVPGVGALGAGAGAARGAGRNGAGTAGRPGISGGATAGGATAGRAGIPGVAGIGGAGQGTGFGDEEEHRTWLTEDEDVWGGASTAAPGVLR